MNKLTTGLAIGIVLGILFAPQEGSKSRINLQKRLNDFINNPEGRIENLKLEIHSAIENVKKDVAKNIEDKVDDVRVQVAEKIYPESNILDEEL